MNEYEIVENCTSIESFIKLAKSLGEIISHPNGEIYDVVIANDGTNAKTGTFSHKFGFNEFPLHTDTAFWAIPARLLIMWSPVASTTSTTILPWRDILDSFSKSDKKIINEAIFLVRTFESTSYRSVKFTSYGETGYRYDPNIMIPANEQGKKFAELFNKAIQKISLNNFNWSGSNALIINNWKMLHGRNQVNNEQESRTIFRAYVR
ncbi:hypothetical protein HFD91_08865 [Enterobacteriaceae bacterium EKM102V]|uniref:TauD/TfdA family dioxygenase n=1 Tax=Pantoea TaxID=53335 RepID=UPI00142D47E2|nr:MULTISPECIES: TauD/TfdA family dioxygenase [Pantoea]KAF6661474.1 hypothetical protein HFD91_08865 [Enterobacteriaceae bacterium EKM102V]KAF6665516.1 hypothetical protein HFD97_16680 [Pantoea sp. EKM103V]